MNVKPLLRKFYERANRSLTTPQVWANEIKLKTLPLFDPHKTFTHRPKIAFVKQEVTPGFYCTSLSPKPLELLETCFKHSGPLGLSTIFDADFPIVKTTSDPETQVWKECVTDAKHGSLQDYEMLRTKPFLNGARGHTRAPGEFALDVDDVDWSKYEIVISANISVPQRIVKKYPQVTWVYFCDPPVTTHYRLSQVKPLYGYDLYLNLRYRLLQIFPKPNAEHVIDWPFDLLYYGVFHDLFETPHDLSRDRKGIFVESHTAKILTPKQKSRLEALGCLKFVSPRTIDIVKDLMASKYFIRLGGRLLWGNAQIEAIAAGSLVVADPKEFLNKSLFTSKTSVSDFDNLLERLVAFEESPDLFDREINKQRALLNYICFVRPLQELFKKRENVLNARHQKPAFRIN